MRVALAPTASLAIRPDFLASAAAGGTLSVPHGKRREHRHRRLIELEMRAHGNVGEDSDLFVQHVVQRKGESKAQVVPAGCAESKRQQQQSAIPDDPTSSTSEDMGCRTAR